MLQAMEEYHFGFERKYQSNSKESISLIVAGIFLTSEGKDLFTQSIS